MNEFPTIEEIFNVVSGDDARRASIGYGSSRQILLHEKLHVSAYWMEKSVAACIVYMTKRKVWAYFIHTEPMRKFSKTLSCYEVNEDEAIKFIEDHGGRFKKDFNAGEEMKKLRGEFIVAFSLCEHVTWGDGDYSEYPKINYKIYRNEDGIRVYADNYAGLWRRCSAEEIVQMYKSYQTAYVGDEWMKHKRKGKRKATGNWTFTSRDEHRIMERSDVELPDEVKEGLSRIRLLKDI